MSWATCYNDCNNICESYPPLVEDGRLYTNYNTASELNKRLKQSNNIQDNNSYRAFLTQNAKNIIEQNRREACNQVGICKYGSNLRVSNNGKYLYKSCQDKTQPFGYETSDLKNMYLTRQDLQSRMSAPLMSQQELLRIPKAN